MVSSLLATFREAWKYHYDDILPKIPTRLEVWSSFSDWSFLPRIFWKQPYSSMAESQNICPHKPQSIQLWSMLMQPRLAMCAIRNVIKRCELTSDNSCICYVVNSIQIPGIQKFTFTLFLEFKVLIQCRGQIFFLHTIFAPCYFAKFRMVQGGRAIHFRKWGLTVDLFRGILGSWLWPCPRQTNLAALLFSCMWTVINWHLTLLRAWPASTHAYILILHAPFESALYWLWSIWLFCLVTHKIYFFHWSHR